ncbi:hypothetical protein FRC04_002855 [Tulasnella sp. 424]|nr:hypothetical protein FRC04_002855 [Tulasnella sp. 424]
MTPGVGRDSDQGSYLQSSNFDENYSFNRPHEDGGWPPAMGSQPGPNPTAIQNRLGMTQGPQESLAAQDGLSWAPANFTPPMTQQIGRERLQTMVNARAFQQQQQASAPPRVPSNQPLQTSPQQQSQPGPSNRQMQFHEFFTIAFNQWLSQRQLTLDPLLVDGKEVALHELFLVVGALGGCRAVFEKKLWPVVGGKIGFPYFNGAIPYSKPEVAEQLSKIYQKILADFEVHWHNSLRPLDPNSIFPLPAQLQYLHPEIGRLTTIQFLLPQPQQPRRPLGAGPQQPPDGGPTAQLSATIASLNVSPEQLSEAREKVRAALNLLANKRDYSSINLSHEQRILLPHSIQQTQSLLKQVAQNLVAFVVLAPNDERELNLVVQTVVTLSDQAQILLRQPPENRFIFGLDDLNQYRNHLTRFLMRVKGLQSQAMGLQSQQASDALPPGPPPPKPPTINSQFTLGKKPVPKRKLPPKRGATKPTSKIPPAEVRGISRPEPERPQSSKREREDNVTGLGGSAGPYGPPKRVRTDRQEDLDAKRAADLAAAKQLTIEGSLHFLPKMAKEDEKVATGVQPEEEEDWSWAIDSTQWATEEEAAPVPSQNAPAPGVNPEEGDDWLWAIDSSQWATEDPAVGETQG